MIHTWQYDPEKGDLILKMWVENSTTTSFGARRAEKVLITQEVHLGAELADVGPLGGDIVIETDGFTIDGSEAIVMGQILQNGEPLESLNGKTKVALFNAKPEQGGPVPNATIELLEIQK